MTIRLPVGVIAGALLLCSAAIAQPRSVSPRDAMLIRQMIENLQQALNTNNPEAWGAEFATDARFINRDGQVLQGQKAIRTSAANAFTGFLKGANSMFRIDRIIPLGPDFALVDATHFVTNVRQMPAWATPTGRGAYQTRARYVVQRFSGTDWQVLALQITPIRTPQQVRR